MSRFGAFDRTPFGPRRGNGGSRWREAFADPSRLIVRSEGVELYVAQTGPMLSFDMTDPLLIYTTPICPYCVRAKQLLDKKRVTYREIDVSGDDAARKYLVEATGRRTVPQIFIAGQSIGGCDDLHDLDRRGLLDELLRQAFGAELQLQT